MKKYLIISIFFNSFLNITIAQTNNSWAYIINDPKKYTYKIQAKLIESTNSLSSSK